MVGCRHWRSTQTPLNRRAQADFWPFTCGSAAEFGRQLVDAGCSRCDSRDVRRGVETLAATESIDRAKPHVEPVFEAAFKRTKFNQSCICLARIDRRIDGLGCIRCHANYLRT